MPKLLSQQRNPILFVIKVQDMQAEITLRHIAIEEKSVLRNLLELCQHDYSEFNGEEVNAHGLFGYKYLDHYWAEAGRYPFSILASGKLAGFALVRTLSPTESGAASEDILYSLAEFFILRKYRRQGIGQNAARLLFDQFPGTWRVGQEAHNVVAQRFWCTVIATYSGNNYHEQPWGEDDGVRQTFRS